MAHASDCVMLSRSDLAGKAVRQARAKLAAPVVNIAVFLLVRACPLLHLLWDTLLRRYVGMEDNEA